MKRFLLLAFTAIFIIAFVSSSIPQQRQPVPITLQKISDNLYEVLGGRGARGGLYIADNGVLVIDAKMNEDSVDKTIEQIKKITEKPIKYLINTHSDGDHTAGNIYFPNTITIIAHENCRKELLSTGRNNTPSNWTKLEMAPFLPSVTFRDKMVLHLGSKNIELWHPGIGHTTGDIVVYFPDEKVAFVGDQFFAERPQLIHSYKGGNSFQHVKTLTRMLQTIKAVKFCSGHSEPVDRRTIQNHISKIKEIQVGIKSLIEKNKTMEEIKNELPEDHSRLIDSIYNELKMTE